MNTVRLNPASLGNEANTSSARTRFHSRSTLEEMLSLAGIRVNGSSPWDLKVHNHRFFNRVLADGTLGFGEAYMDGWWDCDALDEMFFRAIRFRIQERVPWNWRTAIAVLRANVLNFQSRQGARRVARQHYDLGNEFFKAMLDPAMQYSCAYFEGTSDLAEAQQKKLDLICRKLDLRHGMRLLDIGCGWGGLARYAAERFGCEVVGVTISREQQAYAEIACQGLPVQIRLQDYRDVNEQFDRIVSVGMMEHVGHKNHRTYMETVARCLSDDGLFLCHTIGDILTKAHSDPWIERYIFPNSLLPSVSQILRAAEELFVLEDLHSFGAYYDPTLLAWEQNFRSAWPQFQSRYGERFYRMWRFYLLSCAAAFRARNIELYQFVFSKFGLLGGYRCQR